LQSQYSFTGYDSAAHMVSFYDSKSKAANCLDQKY
jgi:hypothetical protein